MSNCYVHRLKIAGSKQQIKEVREYLKGSEAHEYIDFNNVIKLPKDVNPDTDIQRIGEAWGTIWHKDYHQELIDENEIKFHTRATDALYIVDVISKIFPNIDLQLEYWGECGIYGEAKYKNGIISNDFQWDPD